VCECRTSIGPVGVKRSKDDFSCACVIECRTSIGSVGVKRQPLQPTGYNANPPKKSLLDCVDDDPLWSVTAFLFTSSDVNESPR